MVGVLDIAPLFLERLVGGLYPSFFVLVQGIFFFKQKTAYEIGLGIPAEPLFRSIQNRVASNIGISQSTFSVKVLNLFSRSRRKTNKRKSKHSAMLRNKETRHRMFIGLLNTTRKLA